MDGIFISYRRDDSAGYAGRLYDRLAAQFGADRVFMDVAGIELGTDFVTAIEQAVGSCKVLIVVIGDEWLSTTDAAGRQRLDDPHDFVRLETGVALERMRYAAQRLLESNEPIARIAEADRSGDTSTSTSTSADDPTCRALTRVTRRTSASSEALVSTLFTRSSSVIASVSCFTDSPMISAPVMAIMPATSTPAAGSAAPGGMARNS